MAPFELGVCANCETDNVLLKYAGRTMCSKYRCQRAACALVARRKAAACSSTAAQKGKAPPTFCYKILMVHGQRDFDPVQMVGAKRRNHVAVGDFCVSYLVYGEFREHSHDHGFNDLRWVELSDLVSNLTKTQLKPLVVFEKKLEERMSASRQQLSVQTEE